MKKFVSLLAIGGVALLRTVVAQDGSTATPTPAAPAPAEESADAGEPGAPDGDTSAIAPVKSDEAPKLPEGAPSETINVTEPEVTAAEADADLVEPQDPVATPAPETEQEVTEAEVGAEEKKEAGQAAVEDGVTEADTVMDTAAEDADFLPEPTAESLGVPIDGGLPSEGISQDDMPNPDDLLPDDVYSPGDEELAPPPPPVVGESKAEQDRRLRIKYQEAKLQALKDDAVRQMRERADMAATDEAKRQALREYYRLLFARMVALDAELAEKCETMEQAYLRRLGQYRVAPTIPLQPPPTPEPLEIAN